jgi:hypothetical protein
MIRNLNPITFQGFGSVLSERAHTSKRTVREEQNLKKLDREDAAVYRACSNVWLDFCSGMSVLSVSKDGETFQHFYLDKPVCIKSDIYFTLYAFRGIFNAGESDRVYPFLRRYVLQRLLGPHVPYAVEAYPEGNQRHLSAESALFARIITEGLCGITPVGLHTISLNPSVPTELGWVKLSRIHAGGGCFDLQITRHPNGHAISVQQDNVHIAHFIPLGDSFEFVVT